MSGPALACVRGRKAPHSACLGAESLEGCSIVYEAVRSTQYNAFPFFLLAPLLMPSQSLSAQTWIGLGRDLRPPTLTAATEEFKGTRGEIYSLACKIKGCRLLFSLPIRH